jgi:hypothetical protein
MEILHQRRIALTLRDLMALVVDPDAVVGTLTVNPGPPDGRWVDLWGLAVQLDAHKLWQQLQDGPQAPVSPSEEPPCCQFC